MSINRANPTGITTNLMCKTCAGFTLFTPLGGREVLLMNMRGETVHAWELPRAPASHGHLLPNGHLLYAGKSKDHQLTDFRGSSGALVELDWRGNVVWEYEDDLMRHSFLRLKNGKTLVLKWVPVPKEVSASVRGGIPQTERDGVMWGDAIEEVTPAGKRVWDWQAHEHLDVQKEMICPLDPRDKWTNASHMSVSEDGNILISLSRTNTIAIIDKATGDVTWRWGAPYELAHQNCAEFLPNGNVIVFDNGLHPPGFDFGYSRVLEIDPHADRVVWAYQAATFALFYSSIMGGCQRLPNGNTLICESTSGRIFEVTSTREVVWEFVSPYFHDTEAYGNSNIVLSATRYDPDYEGLAGIESDLQ